MRVSVAVLVGVIMGGGAARAQEPSLAAEEEQGAGAFGPETQDYWVGANEFSAISRATPWMSDLTLYHWNTGSSTGHYFARIDLPAGALIRSFECFFFDISGATGVVRLEAQRYDYDANAPSVDVLASVSSAGGSGFIKPFVTLYPGLLVRYRDGGFVTFYTFHAIMPPEQYTRLRACRLLWRRTVSPAPATATFPNDVPTTHPRFRFVEALVAAGITGGCGSGAFCPASHVTRGEMAEFLATALGLHFPY